MAIGAHVTVIVLMVETGSCTDADLVVSCVDVAVITAVPAVLGEKTPAAVIDPSVADHVTFGL